MLEKLSAILGHARELQGQADKQSALPAGTISQTAGRIVSLAIELLDQERDARVRANEQEAREAEARRQGTTTGENAAAQRAAGERLQSDQQRRMSAAADQPLAGGPNVGGAGVAEGTGAGAATAEETRHEDDAGERAAAGGMPGRTQAA